MRRIELLIPHVQKATENERIGSTDGVSLEEYYQYFTEGQNRLQRRILAVNNKVFRTTDTFAASGSESYDNAPFNIFARNMVAHLEFSPTGLDRDYYPLKKATSMERFSVSGSRPSQWILQSGVVLVNCYPLSGTFRRTYNYRLPRLDKRRAVIASRTIGATSLSALTLATTSPYNADDYALDEHLTIVDWNGTVEMRGLPYTGVSSGVVTIQGTTYTFPDGSTAPVGSYVCLGPYSSTHSLLDDQCEDYLLQYCQKRILMRDASGDVGDLVELELGPMIAEILELYADDPENTEIPVTNFQYFQDMD